MTTHQYSADWQPLPCQPACPWCGCGFNAVGEANSETCHVPTAGDFAVCIQCAHASVYLLGGGLRRAMPAEIDDDVRAVQSDVRRLHALLN